MLGHKSVYPSAPLSRWIYSRSLSAQTQEGIPAATRQQADDEERAATAVALGEAQGQAEQAVAAEQAAKDALELERLAREEAEKAREALEARLAALVSRVHVGRISLVSKVSLSCSVRRTWGD